MNTQVISQTMNNQHHKKVFLVLGMHRSGTSAITRALQVLGVGLGDNLMQAVEHNNAKGFWEDLDVVNLNIRILSSIQSDWHALSLVSDEQIEHLIHGPLFNEACELMQQKLANTDSFGLKDPRIAKLVLFWQAVFKAVGVQVNYILAIRNPLSIADSLRKRDGFSQDKSLWLWFGHVIESLAHTQSAQRLIVDYDILLNDASKQCERMANAFGLTINELALAEYHAEFLDQALRHSQYSLADLQTADQSIDCVFYTLYHDLAQAAMDQIKLDDWQQQRLNTYYQHIKAQKYLFALIDDQQHTINQCPKAFKSAVIRLAYQQSDTQQEFVLSSPIKIDCKQKQQVEFFLHYINAINHIRLMPLNERCVMQLHELKGYFADGQQVDLIPWVQGNELIRHGDYYFFDQKHPNLTLSNEALSDCSKLKNIQVSISYLHIGEDALVISLNQLSRDHQQTQGELVQAQGELVQAQGELVQTQGELVQAQNTLTQIQHHLHLITHSRSWRLTSPLRKLVALTNIILKKKNDSVIGLLKLRSYNTLSLIKKTIVSVNSFGLAYTLNRVLTYLRNKEAKPENLAVLDREIESLLDLNKVNNGCVFITHDLSKTGAPILLYQLVKAYKETISDDFIVLTMSEHGNMLPEFQALGSIVAINPNQAAELLEKLYEKGYTKCIANTVLSGRIAKELTLNGIETIYLIHEMPDLIVDNNYSDFAINIVQNHSKVVFGSSFVAQAFTKQFPLNSHNIHIIKQGVQDELIFNGDKLLAREQLSQLLGCTIHQQTCVVLGAGYAHERKGTDLFAQVAEYCLTDYPDKEWLFIWMGDKDAHFEAWSTTVLPNLPICECVKFIAFQEHPDFIFAAANAFLLSSREDPFPGVALASLANAVPVAMFAGTGGIFELLNDQNGRIVSPFDCRQMAEALYELCHLPTLPDKSKMHTYAQYLHSIMALFDENQLNSITTAVSVIVPNYNYANYLEQRLLSILQQTHQPSEIIVLDDCSSDDSVALAKQILADSTVPYQIITNTSNQGVYKQWLKGLSLAKHDLVWIAEADDFAAPEFLSSLLPLFSRNNKLGIAYAQSKIVDHQGVIISDDVRFHTDAINTSKWKRNYVNQGKREIEQALVFRNTIPNVSAAIINKTYLSNIEESLLNYRYCGDWFMYAFLLQQSNIAFLARSLNYFRKHRNNVTTVNSHKVAYIEEVLSIKQYMFSHTNITKTAYEKMRAIFDADFIHQNPQAEEMLPVIKKALDSLSSYNCKHLAVVSFNGTFGGSEVLWYELTKQLAQRKLVVTLLVKRGLLSAEKKQSLETLGIVLVEVNHLTSQSLAELEPDNVLFSIGDHNDGGALFDYCQQQAIEYVIVNQLVKEDMWTTDPASLAQIFRGYRCANATFFTCRNNIEIFERKMGQALHNAHIHFNPISIDRNDKVDYPLIQDAYHLAFPARLLIIHKGQDILLKVLSAEKWRQRNLYVNFYGEGPDEAALEALTRKLGLNQVKFHGYVDNVRSIWEQNHGFILTSHMEGIPIVLLGAMFAGRVSIVTQVGGNAEVIEDNVTGFIANNPSEAAVDEALERAWHNRHNWEQMGQLARNAVLAYYPEQPLVDFENKLKEAFKW